MENGARLRRLRREARIGLFYDDWQSSPATNAPKSRGRGQAAILPGGFVIEVCDSLPRDRRHLARSAALCAGALVLALACARRADAAALNFPPSDFDILNAESGELLGHGHYIVDQTATSLMLHGESRYLNGEYDTEEDKLTSAQDGRMSRLTSFRHEFFDADGSPW